jgi:Tfp pilus assembly PilM family ATPase
LPCKKQKESSLVSKKELSSTEKLLDVIRNREASDDFVAPSPSISTTSEKKSKSLLLKTLHQNKNISIGVDIGYRHLRCIKVARSFDSDWKLLDYTIVPLRADISRGTPDFADFLKSELDKFCGSIKKPNLWANMSSARVEVASILIPKVAKKQIEKAVYWTAKKTMSLRGKDLVFDFEMEGEVVERGITKLAVMTYAAPKKEVQEMKDLFEGIGYSLSGLTITPFGTQNLFKTNWMPSSKQSLAVLYIGRGWSRIDIYSRGNLVLTRGIKAGINTMVQELMEAYNEKLKFVSSDESGTGQTLSPDEPRENMFMDMENARELLYGLSPDSPSTAELMARFELDEYSIFKMINPALDRLVRQTERTFQYNTMNLGNEKVSAVYVSTAMNVYKPIVDYIGDDLGIERDVLDPLEPANPLVNEITANLSMSDRVSFAPALGVALSDVTRTPNLLFTYKDKVRQSNMVKSGRAIFVALTVVLMFCVGVLFVIGDIADRKGAELAKLEKQLKPGIQIDEKVLPLFVSKVQKDKKYLQEYSERYLGIAAISELSLLTPSNIRLLNVTVRIKTPSTKSGKTNIRNLTIEGVVSGEMESFEDSLVKYVLKLQSSPMFSEVKIDKSNTESFENMELLRFTVTVNFV